MVLSDDLTEAGGASPPLRAARRPGVRVWDPIVRLFHWSLVITFVVAWLSAEEWHGLHEYAGYAIAGLLAVRVVWGLIGPRHARFSDFLYRPSAVLGYLADTARLRARRYIGHNPAGGAMVVALIVMLATIVTTGIMMTTDAWWGIAWVEQAHRLSVNLTLVLIGLHLAGVFVASAEHKENLVKSMITGTKRPL